MLADALAPGQDVSARRGQSVSMTRGSVHREPYEGVNEVSTPTPTELAEARDTLARLLALINAGEIDARPAEAACLSGAVDTLAAVLRLDDEETRA